MPVRRSQQFRAQRSKGGVKEGGTGLGEKRFVGNGNI